MKQVINKQPDAGVDYIKIVDIKNLKDMKKISSKALAAMAVWVGKTRLIDNIILRQRPRIGRF